LMSSSLGPCFRGESFLSDGLLARTLLAPWGSFSSETGAAVIAESIPRDDFSVPVPAVRHWMGTSLMAAEVRAVGV
jgi:hypothetical protein